MQKAAKTEQEKADILYVIFVEQMNSWAKKDSLGSVFNQLFSLRKEEELKHDLYYLYTLYKGTDSFFGESSKDCWFSIWHKSIRQTDYFTDCFQRKKIELLTEEEEREFKFLLNKCKDKSFSKTEGKQKDKLFNDTYLRYLDLYSKRKREPFDDSINGKLDSMLWNLIHVDKEALLYKMYQRVFRELDLDYQKVEISSRNN